MVARPAAGEDWPKAEPLLRAFGGVPRGVAARIGAMARSSSDCPLAADAGEATRSTGLALYRDLDFDFVSIVADLDDVADRALWGAPLARC